jgi:RNA polymerase sigma factor (sigma-70 family)
MGYYDGVRSSNSGVKGEVASAYHVASLLDIPAVLVVRPKGAALTLAAVIRGVAGFREDSHICGVIFNDCSEAYYKMYGPAIEEASGITVLGYVPHMEEADFESRHLGLMTAEEIEDLTERIDAFLAGCPAQKRRVFVKRYWFFESVSDIALECGMSESRVKSMLFRMRKMLKKYLAEGGYEI